MESFGFEYCPSGAASHSIFHTIFARPGTKTHSSNTPAPLPPSFARPPCHAPPLQSNVQVA